ncbi:unnamed protein product [Rotaria magnacalcarata]|uniref:PH domain-containing protein n=3 Tax=Rotaria magnacalcarata TaxID=392030 RepID=A0A819KA38_9BILA|nr:unnamed protein product [Rotaria magnacalcarata]CAF2033690.1 unnamed protein product [Rotaria magnacalcarata]CAF2259462.1 unnamed protein product [Rotaria magnacalcarata]CAF3828201.1 unnamed protein product [Rotaria magnacalcarata]CAF3940960.1 unnamed protein product [Rotaria magnacalcarata]
MAENIDWKMNEDDEQPQEESSSRHLLIALEDLLKRSHNSSTLISKIKYQSKSRSVDDLLIHRRYRQGEDQNISTNHDTSNNISNTTRVELDLSGIGHDDESYENDLEIQRSRSAPVSPTKIYDKELAAFIECEQQQSIADNFVYNIDLSDDQQTVHQQNSRLAIFFDDDFSLEENNYEPSVSLINSSINNNCLTITEENEEELEQLQRDDDEEQRQRQKLLLEISENSIPIITLENDNDDQTDTYENDNQMNKREIHDMNNLLSINIDHCENSTERLSTIYETPSPQPEIEEEEIDNNTDDKLVVYDIANVDTSTKSSIIQPTQESTTSTTLFHLPSTIDRNRIGSCYTNAFFKPCPNFINALSASRLCGTTTMITSKVNNPSSLLSTSLLTTIHDENSSSLPAINAENNSSFLSPKQQSSSRSSPMLFVTSVDEQPSPAVDHDKLPPSQPSSQHIKKMKVFQSSSSSLSDFISPTPTPKSQLPTTTLDEDVLSIHHSLTDCSSLDQTSTLINKNKSTINQISDNPGRKSTCTRRILTNGLLFPHATSSPIARRLQEPLTSIHNNHYSIKQKIEETHLSDSSLSSVSLSSSDENLFSRSDYSAQQDRINSQKRKASSLKSICTISHQIPSKILYPIDFDANNLDLSWHKKQSFRTNKVPTSDSGIIIDTHSTPKSSSEDDDHNNGVIEMDQIEQCEIKYRRTLDDLTTLKKNIVNTESRLNEAMRELEIEQALIEGEHDLVFKQILDASESDQQKIRQLNDNLQLLIERMMTEKNSIRDEIDYTKHILFEFENELHKLEQNYRSSDEKILKTKEIIAVTRKNYEDLEFQLMVFETHCESELGKAEQHFQNEQKLVTQNAQIRQNTLQDLDHEQYIALYQAIMEKEKLQREKQKLKLAFKQKKLEANELEKKIYNTWSNIDGTKRNLYQSTPIYLYRTLNCSDRFSSSKTERKDDHHENSHEIKDKMTKVKLEKLSERYNEKMKRIEVERKLATKIERSDYEVKLREKYRIQERPLTRYLPIRAIDFDLRAHIEGAGHSFDSSHIILTSTSCRGYLHKMGGVKFKTWNRRWFVFDRERRSLFYYHDKTETKLRGCIYFQSVLEVYVDHLQSTSLRLPEPREATFIVKTIERPYYLVAPTVELMRIWVDVIITGAEGNTFAGV